MGYYKSLIGSGSSRRVPIGAPLQPTVDTDTILAEDVARKLARISVENPDARKLVKDTIRKELREARKRIVQDVRSGLNSDPRKAYLAVKYSLYKRILGGNLSILNPRRTGSRYKLIVPRKLDMNPNQRGGNRRPINDKLNDRSTYFGKDRAFILRFINSGTDERETRFGKRGSLRQTRIFETSSAYQIETAQDNIAKLIEEVLQEVIDKD